MDPASSPKAEIASPNYMESVKRLTKGETQIDPTQEVKMATNAGSLKDRVKLGQGKGRTLEIPKRGKQTKNNTPLSPGLKPSQVQSVEKQETEFLEGCNPGPAPDKLGDILRQQRSNSMGSSDNSKEDTGNFHHMINRQIFNTADCKDF